MADSALDVAQRVAPPSSVHGPRKAMTDAADPGSPKAAPSNNNDEESPGGSRPRRKSLVMPTAANVKTFVSLREPPKPRRPTPPSVNNVQPQDFFDRTLEREDSEFFGTLKGEFGRVAVSRPRANTLLPSSHRFAKWAPPVRERQYNFKPAPKPAPLKPEELRPSRRPTAVERVASLSVVEVDSPRSKSRVPAFLASPAPAVGAGTAAAAVPVLGVDTEDVVLVEEEEEEEAAGTGEAAVVAVMEEEAVVLADSGDEESGEDSEGEEKEDEEQLGRAAIPITPFAPVVPRMPELPQPQSAPPVARRTARQSAPPTSTARRDVTDVMSSAEAPVAESAEEASDGVAELPGVIQTPLDAHERRKSVMLSQQMAAYKNKRAGILRRPPSSSSLSSPSSS